MIKARVYLYNSSASGYRGTEITDSVLQGFADVQDLTQELDTSEMTAYLSQKEAFIPQTKFIIDFEQDGNVIDTIYRMVEEDTVTKPNLSTETYKHSISLIEPSVTAQKRIVDNISTTYRLKNVTLQRDIGLDLDELSGFNIVGTSFKPIKAFGNNGLGGAGRTDYAGKYFVFDGVPVWQSASSTFDNNKKYLDIAEFGSTAYITLPKLKLYGGIKNTTNFTSGLPVSIYYKVVERNELGEETGVVSEGNIVENTDLSQVYQPFSEEFGGWGNANKEWLVDYVSGNTISRKQVYIRKYTDTSAPTPSYNTTPFTVKAGHSYSVLVTVANFTDNAPSLPYVGGSTLKAQDDFFTNSIDYQFLSGTSGAIRCNEVLAQENTYSQTGEYFFYSQATKKETFQQGEIYSAYSLLCKAIQNSYIGTKQDGVSSVSLAQSPFYIDTKFEPELLSTNVIESFYHQKNLWEILLEVGYYIHAIPKIVFGDNEKFKITFVKLGETEEDTNQNTKITITNFRGVGDYVSATTSYITNLMEVGGQIDEWVAPNTLSEDYLVSNSTVVLKTSKKINEILKIEVRCKDSTTYASIGITDQVADITNFIFEEWVYKTLDWNVATTPNKGASIYYQLGTNEIKGLTVRTPRENTDKYEDYAIKKIIWKAYHPTTEWSQGNWGDIAINDFVFHIVYRTQDTTRLVHSRPDLRKYLLDTPFDIVPKHEQINNQEDVVVDSSKFGSNIYGTLIRTGNLNYQEQEYVTDLTKIKRKGEICRINGEIYYVSKVTTTYFPNHAVSIIDFSKDYNQLSKVIGIPSEPRFSEISERSTINREVAINDYLLVTTNTAKILNTADEVKKVFLQDKSHLINLIVGDENGTTDFAKYVVTTFKGDKDIGSASGTFGDQSHYKDILVPVNAYSSGCTLTYEWDMKDNFGAGDKSVEPTQEYEKSEENAYRSLEAVRYCDTYGKSTLFDFYLLKDLRILSDGQIVNNLSYEQIMALPESPFQTSNTTPSVDDLPFIESQDILVSNRYENDNNNNGRGLILLKDCRETISFNYNLQLLTDSDQFVVSPHMFTPNKKQPKLVLLSEEVNKLSNGLINTGTIIGDENQVTIDVQTQEYTYTDNFGKQKVGYFIVDIASALQYVSRETQLQVKAIALIYDFNEGKSKQTFTIARNIPDNTNWAIASAQWKIGTPNTNELFLVKQ